MTKKLKQSPAEPTVRVAVASDLHVVTETGAFVATSHLRSGDTEDQVGRQPVGGLLKLISDNELQADLFLCPGDVGDKANPDAIKYGWDALHRVAGKLKCNSMVGSTGNHDVDSRLVHHKFDPVEVLKNLVPPYPFGQDDLNGHYWMHHFAVYESDSYRVLVINSSAYHGANENELKNGRISPVTLTKVQQYLENVTFKFVNLVLCHHHPQQHSELKLGDYDWMREGQQLLDLLGNGRFGRWTFVHGHKHHPKITYAAGGATSPIVLSAGSFAAVLYPELGTEARNQFYLLTFNLTDMDRFGLVGSGQAWDWATSRGWVPASSGSGLPAHFWLWLPRRSDSICCADCKTVEGQKAG